MHWKHQDTDRKTAWDLYIEILTRFTHQCKATNRLPWIALMNCLD